MAIRIICLTTVLLWVSETVIADSLTERSDVWIHQRRAEAQAELRAMGVELSKVQASLKLARQQNADAPDGDPDLAREIERLENRQAELVVKIARVTKVIIICGPGVDENPRRFAGHARILDARKNLCEISAGTDDGVQAGMQLNVYRDGKLVARIVIRKANPDRSVGERISELSKGALQKLDDVRAPKTGPMPEVLD